MSFKCLLSFSNQNISKGYSKQLPERDGFLDHRDHVLKLADNKMITILQAFSLSKTYGIILNKVNKIRNVTKTDHRPEMK